MHFQIADRVDQFPKIFRHSPKGKPPKNRAAKPFSQRAPCARCFYIIKIRKSPRGLRPRYRSCSPLSGCAPTGRRAPSPRRASPPPVGAHAFTQNGSFAKFASLRSLASLVRELRKTVRFVQTLARLWGYSPHLLSFFSSPLDISVRKCYTYSTPRCDALASTGEACRKRLAAAAACSISVRCPYFAERAPEEWLHHSTAADDLSKTIRRLFLRFFRLFQPFSPLFAAFRRFSAACADSLRFAFGV